MTQRSSGPIIAAFSRFFDELDEALLVVEQTGRVAHANPGFVHGAGLAAGTVVGRFIDELVADDQCVLLRAFIRWQDHDDDGGQSDGTNRPDGPTGASIHPIDPATPVQFRTTMRVGPRATWLQQAARQRAGLPLLAEVPTCEVVMRWTAIPDSSCSAVSIEPAPGLAARSGHDVTRSGDYARSGAFVTAQPVAHRAGGLVSSPSRDHGELIVQPAQTSGSHDGTTGGLTASAVDRRRATVGRGGRAPLSLRERQIMQLVLDGNRVSTVAAGLYLSENTVRNHLKRIYRKVGVSSLGELREAVRVTERAS